MTDVITKDRPTLRELAQEIAAALPGVSDLSVEDDHIRLDFAESEFQIRLCDTDELRPCLVRFTAVVRETSTCGRSWWAEWSITHLRGTLPTVIADEVSHRRTRYKRILADNLCRDD
jgi:hypothetical protein